MRRSTVDWPAVLERFSSSGLSQKAFCEQNGISISTFNYWMKKRRGGYRTGELTDETGSKFVELEFIPGLQRAMNGAQDLVVELPLGVVLRFRGPGR